MPEWTSEPEITTPYAPVCQPPGAAVSSTGSTVSTRTVWSCQPVALPATSNARVRSVCSPSPTIETSVLLATLCIDPPSSCHSTWSTPETASVADTVTVRVVGVQERVPESVVSVGGLMSMLTVSGRHGGALPATSTAGVMSVKTPELLSEIGVALAMSAAVPPSTQYCMCAPPDSASLPVSVTVYTPMSQPPGAAG